MRGRSLLGSAGLQPKIKHSYLENLALALDAIEDAGVVNWDVLLCDHLDDFLRYNATSEGSNVVQFGPSCSSTAYSLAVLMKHCRSQIYLQFLRKFTNLSLDCCVLWVFHLGSSLVDQVVHDLMSNTGELLSIYVCICLTGCLWCTAKGVLVVGCGELVPCQEDNIEWDE